MTNVMTKVNTKPFGEIEINESQIVNFKEGIFAFEQYNKFALLAANEEANFHWLQCLEESSLAFLVMRPESFLEDYNPNVPKFQIEAMGLDSIDQAEVWAIISIPANHPEDMTVNLQGPIIINPGQKLGGQYISENDRHGIRMPVLKLIEAGKLIEC
jgi:flagellar assembly factor FliW